MIMTPLIFRPDRGNLTVKKSNTKRFRLHCIYEIYWLAESAKLSAKLEIERKKPWRETDSVQGRSEREWQATLLFFCSPAVHRICPYIYPQNINYVNKVSRNCQVIKSADSKQLFISEYFPFQVFPSSTFWICKQTFITVCFTFLSINL